MIIPTFWSFIIMYQSYVSSLSMQFGAWDKIQPFLRLECLVGVVDLGSEFHFQASPNKLVDFESREVWELMQPHLGTIYHMIVGTLSTGMLFLSFLFSFLSISFLLHFFLSLLCGWLSTLCMYFSFSDLDMNSFALVFRG